MELWGAVSYNPKRKRWFVRGRWKGKRRQFSLIPTKSDFLPCTTKDHAKWLQVDISKEIARGTFQPERYQKAKPLHVDAYADRWLEMKKPNLKYKTWEGYRTYITHYIKPGLGGEFLPDLTHEKILIWLNGIDKSMAYKKKIHACLRCMLNDAKRSAYIAELPEPVKFRAKKKTIEWIDKETQDKILDKIPSAHRYIFKFLFLTGVRPSEARALQKSDIKKDHIVIRYSMGPVKGGEELKEVKTGNERKIPLLKAVKELLDSIPPVLSSFVFINPTTKKPYSKNINRDVWNPACKKALGFVFPLNNSGRHSFANQLLEQGLDMESVSYLLGHADTSTTKANYARPKVKVIGGKIDKLQGN